MLMLAELRAEEISDLVPDEVVKFWRLIWHIVSITNYKIDPNKHTLKK